MTDARFAEIEGHRPCLVRYALAQLRDGPLAEEAVQEALLAALGEPRELRRQVDAAAHG